MLRDNVLYRDCASRSRHGDHIRACLDHIGDYAVGAAVELFNAVDLDDARARTDYPCAARVEEGGERNYVGLSCGVIDYRSALCLGCGKHNVDGCAYGCEIEVNGRAVKSLFACLEHDIALFAGDGRTEDLKALFVLVERTDTEVTAAGPSHLCFAESCTGGGAVARLVGVPNASAVLDVSFVAYANEAKMKFLSVSEVELATYGAVSPQVALSMARGAAAAANAQVGVGISGIAGPDGGTAEKPVGTVCFGFVIGDEEFALTEHFGDLGRNSVRQASVDKVYETLHAYLTEK